MSDLGNKAVMAKNINYYMEKQGKTRTEMCEALGVKYTTFTDWVKGNTYPRIDKIELMANYFGITKADLVEDKPKDYVITSGDMELLIEITKNYDESTMQRLLLYAKKLKELQDIENSNK